MVLVGVLDHGDLELSGQAEDRRGRKHVHRHPAVVEVAARIDVDPGGFGAREDRLEPATRIDDEDADRQERGELDDGFEGDGRDDAVVLLLGIDIACAEQDREQRHPRRDGQRQPDLVDAAQRPAGKLAHPGDRLQRRGDRLELQRDIGRDADHRDDGDEHRQPARLAEARRQQVGDRGDALVVADADEAAEHEPPADEHQRRPQIDGEILETAARRRTHGAVKGPAGAIDRDGERVDEGRAQERRLVVARLPVAHIGDEEQQPDIADGDGDDHVRRQHQPSPSDGGSASGSRGRRRPSQKAAAIRPSQQTNR